MFLINLTLSDLLKLDISMPMTVISSFNGKWYFGKMGCDFCGFTVGLFGFISISTLALMSIERFMIVKSPLRAFKFNFKMKVLSIIFTWIYSAAFMSGQLFSERGFIYEGFQTSCTFDYLSRDFYTRTFILVMVIGGFVIPLIVVIIFYSWTKSLLSKKSKLLVGFYMKGQNNKTSKRAVLINGTQLSQKHKPYSILAVNLRVLKMIILNIILFCIAWLPYCIVTLYGQFGSDIENYVTPFTTSLPGLFAKLSSIYNPVLYVLTNKKCVNYFKSRLMFTDNTMTTRTSSTRVNKNMVYLTIEDAPKNQ